MSKTRVVRQSVDVVKDQEANVSVVVGFFYDLAECWGEVVCRCSQLFIGHLKLYLNSEKTNFF